MKAINNISKLMLAVLCVGAFYSNANAQEVDDSAIQLSAEQVKKSVSDVTAAEDQAASNVLTQASDELEQVSADLDQVAQQQEKKAATYSYWQWLIPLALALLLLSLARTFSRKYVAKRKKHRHGDLHRGHHLSEHELSEHERSEIKRRRQQELHRGEREEKKRH